MTNAASVKIRRLGDFRFLIDFGAGIPQLQADDTAPLGAGEEPSPDQLLLAAVANCLSSSLFFALREFKQDAGNITTTVTARIDRNEDKRLRLQETAVVVQPGKRGDEVQHLDRILSQFESFCTVTESVRRGIPVVVAVEDKQGTRLK